MFRSKSSADPQTIYVPKSGTLDIETMKFKEKPRNSIRKLPNLLVVGKCLTASCLSSDSMVYCYEDQYRI
jgi:hypothetical protein